MDRNDPRYHSMENIELVHGASTLKRLLSQDDSCLVSVGAVKEALKIRKEDEITAVKDHINPDHYKSSTSLECIEAMELVFGRKAVVNFCICNAWKYIWRWKHKNGIEDLEKAKWYVNKANDLLNMGYQSPDALHLFGIIDNMRNYIEVNNRPEQDGDK